MLTEQYQFLPGKELFANTEDVEYVVPHDFNYLVNEDQSFVPRFSFKNIDIFKDIPVNEPIRYNQKIMIKAIQYGMIFLVNYKGEKDKHFAGHERVIYPMVLGKSSKGKELLRGYHLSGWSVSNNRNIKKIWRMFRTDRILSITFIGSFYRLPPEGYNMDDRGMRGGIIAAADFRAIRKNQEQLLKKQVIQDKEEVTIDKKESKFSVIKVEDTESELDLDNPFENEYMASIEDVDNIRLSFLKSTFGNKYIAVLGAVGRPSNTVKVMIGNRTLGVYKVMDSIAGDTLKKIKRIKGNTIYDLYIFDKKV